MSKFHINAKHSPTLGAGGIPLCGARGIDRYKTVTVSAAQWNATSIDNRCARCVEANRKRREVRS